MHVGIVFKQLRDPWDHEDKESEVVGVYSSLDRANMVADSICDRDWIAWFEIHEVE